MLANRSERARGAGVRRDMDAAGSSDPSTERAARSAGAGAATAPRAAGDALPPLARAGRVAVPLACAAALALTFLRLRFGVDHSDEAFYLALPWRFVLGDRPFVDEVNPCQTAALLTLPLVRLWVAATGGIEGAIYFGRVLWFLLACAVAASAFAYLRRFVDRSTALVTALACVVFMPLALPNLSYNTLSSGFFALGLFLGIGPFRTGRRPLLLVGIGVFHAFAVIAIATYALPCAVFAAAACAPLRGKALGRRLGLYLLGGLLGAAPFVPDLLNVSADTLAYTEQYLHGFGARIGKLQYVLIQHGWIVPRRPWLVAALLLLLVSLRLRWRIPAWIALFGLPLLVVQTRGVPSATCYVSLVALTAPVLMLLLRDRKALVEPFVCVWIPSACAGLDAAWTSGNGIVNAGFGYLPGALFAAVAAARLALEIGAWKGQRPVAAAALVWPFLVACALLAYQRNVYNDDPVPELTARIDEGPFRGLRTTPEKKAFVESIAAAVAQVERPGARVIFFLHFTAGYLMTRMPPAAHSVWYITSPPEKLEDAVTGMRRDIQKYGDPEDVIVVRVDPMFHHRRRTVDWRRGAVDEMLEGSFRTILEGDCFTVFSP